MSIQLYPSIAKIKRNGVYENLPGFVPETGSIATQQMIATSESSATAQYVHNKGEYFRLNDTLYQAIVKINVGDAIVVGTNCEVAVIGNDLTHVANSIAAYELGIATSSHNTGDYFMVNETMYVATADIQVGDNISASTNCRVAVVGDELSALQTAITQIESVMNGDEWINTPFKIAGEGYIKHADGTVGTSTANSYTDYIDISYYNRIKYKRAKSSASSPSGGIAFYDSNKSYISGNVSVASQPTPGYAEELAELLVPNNAVYMRATTYTDTQTYGNFEVYGYAEIIYEIETIKNSIVEQTQNIWNGKSKYDVIGGSGIAYIRTEKIYEAGTYTFSGIITSSDTDSDKSVVSIYDATNSTWTTAHRLATTTVDRDKTFKFTFTASQSFNRFLFCAGNSISASSGKNVSVTNLQLEIGNKLTEYIPPITATDFVARKIFSDVQPLEFCPVGLYENNNIDIEGLTTTTEVYSAYDTLIGTSNRSLLGYGSDSTGQADENLPIYEYVIHNPIQGNHAIQALKILLTSGIHGDEKVAVVGLYNFIKSLFDNTNEIAEHIRLASEIHIVPIINPYGFNNNQRRNAHNVDINRNFGVNWGNSSYQGTAPYSEPETQAMVTWLQNNNDALFYIDFHNHVRTNSLFYVASEVLMHKKAWSYTFRQLIRYMREEYNEDITGYDWVCERNAIPGVANEAYTKYHIESSILETPMGEYATYGRKATEASGDFVLSLLRNYKV